MNPSTSFQSSLFGLQPKNTRNTFPAKSSRCSVRIWALFSLEVYQTIDFSVWDDEQSPTVFHFLHRHHSDNVIEIHLKISSTITYQVPHHPALFQQILLRLYNFFLFPTYLHVGYCRVCWDWLVILKLLEQNTSYRSLPCAGRIRQQLSKPSFWNNITRNLANNICFQRSTLKCHNILRDLKLHFSKYYKHSHFWCRWGLVRLNTYRLERIQWNSTLPVLYSTTNCEPIFLALSLIPPPVLTKKFPLCYLSRTRFWNGLAYWQHHSK